MEKPNFSFRENVALQLVERKNGGTGKILIYDGQIQVGLVSFHYNYLHNSYYFYGLSIFPDFRSNEESYREGAGFGSNLVEAINTFLISKKAKGFLENGISEDQKLKLYTKHGWKFDGSLNKYYFDATNV